MSKPDGGSAFPHLKLSVYGHDGMSLRDWLAGQALAGVLGGTWNVGGVEKRNKVDNATHAKWCYEMADDMITARQS